MSPSFDFSLSTYIDRKCQKENFNPIFVIHEVSASLAEVFYYVNYVNVNYSAKNLTVDCKYLLFLQDFFSLDQNQNSTKNANCLKNTSGNS